jgi:hypothetical protein
MQSLLAHAFQHAKPWGRTSDSMLTAKGAGPHPFLMSCDDKEHYCSSPKRGAEAPALLRLLRKRRLTYRIGIAILSVEWGTIARVNALDHSKGVPSQFKVPIRLDCHTPDIDALFLPFAHASTHQIARSQPLDTTRAFGFPSREPSFIHIDHASRLMPLCRDQPGAHVLDVEVFWRRVSGTSGIHPVKLGQIPTRSVPLSQLENTSPGGWSALKLGIRFPCPAHSALGSLTHVSIIDGGQIDLRNPFKMSSSFNIAHKFVTTCKDNLLNGVIKVLTRFPVDTYISVIHLRCNVRIGPMRFYLNISLVLAISYKLVKRDDFKPSTLIEKKITMPLLFSMINGLLQARYPTIFHNPIVD